MRRQILVTLSATPTSIGSLLGNGGVGPQMLATEVFCQMQAGGSGIGYVMDQTGQPLTTAVPPVPNTSASTAVAVQLSPATAGAPGGTYSDQVNHPRTGQRVDLNQFYVAGANAGDKMLVQWWQVN